MSNENLIPHVDQLIGTTVSGYVVKGRIGQGGMGVVYEGEQAMIGKKVAIKVLRSEFAENPEVVQRLVSEARAVNAVGHRGIIDVFAYSQMPNGQHCIVMEFLEGEPLDEVIDAHHSTGQRLPIPDTLLLLQETLSALASAHTAGVIHRDLKPSNIFLCRQRDGSRFVKLLDFGIAKLGVIGGNVDAARASMMVGTPTYMAPEQAAGGLVSPALDLYAVGVIAFELLTGRLPFDDTSVMEVLLAHAQKAPPEPKSLHPEIPQTLNDLVLKLLAKKPEDRPQNGLDVASQFEMIRDRIISVAPMTPGANSRVTFSENLSAVVKARRNSKEVPAIVALPKTVDPVPLGAGDTMASNGNLKPVQSTINQRLVSMPPSQTRTPSLSDENDAPIELPKSSKVLPIALGVSLLAATVVGILVLRKPVEPPVVPVIAPVIAPVVVPVVQKPVEPVAVPVAVVVEKPVEAVVIDAGVPVQAVAAKVDPVKVEPVKVEPVVKNQAVKPIVPKVPAATGLDARINALQNRLKKAEAAGVEVSIYKTTVDRIKAKLKTGVTPEERDRLDVAVKRLEDSSDY